MTPTRPVLPHLSQAMNVTPLLDVLLVLFIIYILLVCWRFVLPVQVPVAQKPGIGTGAPPAIVLELTADGEFRVNRHPVSTGELPGYLRTMIRQHPGAVVYVSADSNRIYQDVISAMDLARGMGAGVVSLGP